MKLMETMYDEHNAQKRSIQVLHYTLSSLIIRTLDQSRRQLDWMLQQITETGADPGK